MAGSYLSIKRWAVCPDIAKLILTAPLSARPASVFTPTTQPDLLIKGPPELPWLIAVSVWTIFPSFLRLLITPLVRLKLKPCGAPMAITSAPTIAWPFLIGRTFPSFPSTFNKAKSFNVDEASPSRTTTALSLFPSDHSTLILLAPWITWLLVRMSVWFLICRTTKPLPEALSVKTVTTPGLDLLLNSSVEYFLLLQSGEPDHQEALAEAGDRNPRIKGANSKRFIRRTEQ